MHKRRIYVASSWRNDLQPNVVATLLNAGHEVYDFKNPPGRTGFGWQQCAVDGDVKTIEGYLMAVSTQRAIEGFASDKAALDWCDTCILVLPCGRSAHLEAGYTAGQGKDTYFLLHPDKFEPELMYLLGTAATSNLGHILAWMDAREPGDVLRWHQENGGHGSNLAACALRALREMIELCFAAGSTVYDMREAIEAEFLKEVQGTMEGKARGTIPGEWADVAILLQVFARYASVDQHKVIRDKVDILWQRQWKADQDGVLWRP